MKAAVVQAIYSLGRAAHPPQEVGENQLKQHRARGTKGMVKARAAPAAELIEDVVRTPRPASSKALPRTLSPERRCRAPGKAFPFTG
jgi:hypothetical protein